MRRGPLAWLPAAAALLGAACASARPAPAEARDTAPARIAGSVRRFPNPLLRTQQGERVRLYDDLVRGRVVMVNFAYTRCTGSCPPSAARLVEVQRLLGERFGRDVTLLTLSLDPDGDTPEAMSRYVAAHGGRPGWIWLTGRAEDLDAVRRFLGLADRDPALDADRTRHTALVLLGNDRTGRWTSIPALARPERIVDALLRTAAEPRPSGAPQAAATPRPAPAAP